MSVQESSMGVGAPTGPSDPDNLPPGTVLLGGELVIEEMLGRGGASTVYAATRADGKTVALKVLASRHADVDDMRQRFENEARIVASLGDLPCIVRVHGFGPLPELDGRLSMTQDLVVGPTFASRLVWRLPLRIACGVVRDVADALARIHERGVIHRDIKPSNIMSARGDEPERTMLLDFGVAYSLGVGGVPATAGLTQFDQRPGTKHYMAPEQALALPPTPQFDIYALAVTLYEALVGDTPFRGLTPDEAIWRKCDSKLPSPSIAGERSDLPESLVRLVDDGLEREPGKRIASAAVFRDRLDEVLAELARNRLESGPVAMTLVASPRPLPGVEHTTVGRMAPRNAPPVAVDDDVPQRRTPSDVRDQVEHAAEPPIATHRKVDPPASADASVAGGEPIAALAFEAAAESSTGHRAKWWVAAAGLAALMLFGLYTWQARNEDLSSPEPPQPRALAPAAAVPSAESSKGPATPPPTTSPRPTEPTTVPPTPVPEEPPPQAARPDSLRPSTPRVVAHETEVCVAERNATMEAKNRRDWKAVLAQSGAKRCWPNLGLRLRLRVQALLALGEYEQCIREGSSSQDELVVRNVAFCREKQEGS